MRYFANTTTKHLQCHNNKSNLRRNERSSHLSTGHNGWFCRSTETEIHKSNISRPSSLIPHSQHINKSWRTLVNGDDGLFQARSSFYKMRMLLINQLWLSLFKTYVQTCSLTLCYFRVCKDVNISIHLSLNSNLSYVLNFSFSQRLKEKEKTLMSRWNRWVETQNYDNLDN